MGKRAWSFFVVCLLALQMVSPVFAAEADVLGEEPTSGDQYTMGTLAELAPVITPDQTVVSLNAGDAATVDVSVDNLPLGQLDVSVNVPGVVAVSPAPLVLDGEGKGSLAITAEALLDDASAVITLTGTNGDGQGSAAITVNVAGPAAPSVALSPAAIEVEQDGSASLSVTVADGNTPPQTVSATAASDNEALLASPGALALDGAGQCTLPVVPVAGQNGTATLTVTAVNASGKTATSAVTVTVTTLKTAPSIVLSPAALTLEDDETRDLSITVQDTNSPPLALGEVTVTSSDPAVIADFGPLTLDAGGSCTLSIDPSPVSSPQTVRLTVTAENAAGKQGSEFIDVEVNPATLEPRLSLNNDVFTMDEDGPAFSLNLLDPTAGYLTNDGSVAVSLAPDPDTTTEANGTVSVAAGVVTYTPNPNHFTPADKEASDTIGVLLQYQKHGQLKSVAYTLRVKVLPVEDAPLVSDYAVNATSGEAVTVYVKDILTAATSVDNGELELTGFNAAGASYEHPLFHGQITEGEDENGPYLRYTPHIRYTGWVKIPYAIKNKGGSLAAVGADLVITVAKGQGATPQFEDMPTALLGTEDTPFSFTFRVRDADVPAPPASNLTVTAVSDNTAILPNTAAAIQIATAPVQGDDDAIDCTVQLAFVLNANTVETARYGGPLNLTVAVADDEGHTNEVILPVTVAAQNDAPVLELVGVSGPSGSHTFEMNEDASQSFQVRVSDVDMPADVLGYGLTVVSDTVKVLPNAAANIQIGAPQRSGDTLVYTVILKPAPNANTQQDEFSQQPVTLAIGASDGAANSNNEELAVTVLQVRDAPVAVADRYTLDKNVEERLYVVKNDTVHDGKATVQITACGLSGNGETDMGGTVRVETDSGGSAALGTGQYILYTPKKNTFGEDWFEYTITDDLGKTSTARVDISVLPKNYPPEFVGLLPEDPDQYYTTNEDTLFAQLFSVDDDITNPGGMQVQCSVIENVQLVDSLDVETPAGQEGTGNRRLWVQPAADKNSYGGKYVVVRLRMSDGTYTVDRKVRLFITPDNDAPVPGDVTLEFDEGQAKTYTANDILKLCTDPDSSEGDTVSLISFDTPSSGAITTTSADGVITGFTYTPVAFFDGTATVKYTIRDSKGATAIGTLKLKAKPFNDPPYFTQAPPASIVMDEDGEWKLELKYRDPEMKHPILLLKSHNEEILNPSCVSYTNTTGSDGHGTGAIVTLKPRKDRSSDTPFDLEITVTDGNQSVNATVSLTVRPVPDKPVAPEQNYATMESTELEFDPLLVCTDVDENDHISVVPGSITPVKSIDDDGTVGSETGSVSWDAAKQKWIFTPALGFVGQVFYEYTVQDDFDGIFQYPATFTDPGYPAYPGIGGGDIYDGQKTGTLIFQVGTSAVGPSVHRLSPIIAFAGQEMDARTLVTKNIVKDVPYTITVEVLGGPVDPATLQLDGGGASLTTSHSSDTSPEHTLEFQLKPGVVGDGLVRVTVEQDGVSNAMSFRVTTHKDNKPPKITTDPLVVECEEGTTFTIDVIADAGIADPEGQPLRFTRLLTGGISDDTVRIVPQGDSYVLSYTAAAKRNARNSPNQVTFQYVVADKGGGETTGSVTVKIHSKNHAPYTWGFYHVQDLGTGVSIELDRSVWGGRAHDYDGDKRYLNDAWCDAADDGNNGVNPVSSISVSPDGERIILQANTTGWITLRYNVYSQYMDDPGATKDASKEGSRDYSFIYLYIADGSGTSLIPPRASSTHWEHREDDGDGTVYRPEITSLLFGDGSNANPANPNLRGDITVTDANGQLDNVSFEKETDGSGKHHYYIEYSLVKDKNRYNDALGNLTGTSTLPKISLTVWNENDPDQSTPVTAKATYTVYIEPQNDIPVLEDDSLSVTSSSTHFTLDGISHSPGNQQAEITLRRDETADIKVKITDLDYPTQSLCNGQISLVVTSSEELAVQAGSCEIIPPVGESDEWTVRMQAFVPGKTTTLTLKAYDESGGVSSETVEVLVHVNGENEPPVAKNYYAIFDEESIASVQVLIADSLNKDDDSDPNGDPVTILLDEHQTDLPGKVRVDGDKITFIPANDFCHETHLEDVSGWLSTEEIAIRYKLEDAPGDVSHNTDDADGWNYVYLHFNPVNDAPRFVNTAPEQAVTETTGGTITFSILDVDSSSFDANSFRVEFTDTGRIQSADVVSVTGPVGGVYTITVNIVPVPYECHTDAENPSKLTLYAKDDLGAESSHEIGLRISPVNDAPAFDTDTNPDFRFPLCVKLDGGRLETIEDHSVTFDLAPYFTDKDAGDELYILSVDNAKHGTVTTNGTLVTFTPTADYCTLDENDAAQWGSFEVVVADRASAQAAGCPGTVRIFVVPENDPPVLRAMSYSCVEDTPYYDITNLFPLPYNKSAPVWDVDDGRTDLAISAVGKGGVTTGVTEAGVTNGGGTVSIESADGHDWVIRYSPAPDFNGTDTFFYTVRDKGGAEATQKITVQVSPEDDDPRGNFENSDNWIPTQNIEAVGINPWVMDEDGSASFQFRIWDPDGGTVLFTANPSNLTNSNCANLSELLYGEAITNSGSGELRTIHINPAADKYGDFELEFILTSNGGSMRYTVPVSVRPVNDAPTLADAAFSTDEDTPLNGQVTGQDVETAGTALAYSHYQQTAPYDGPHHGTVSVAANGKFTYTPDDNYFGPDDFYIQVADKGATGQDDDVETAVAKISITVVPKNDRPSAPADLTLTPAHSKGGDTLTLSWTGGEDLPAETKRENLTYEAEWRVDGGSWAGFTLQNQSGPNGSFAYTAEVPSTLTAGKNTNSFEVRLYTKDDGKCYLGGSEHASQAPLRSVTAAVSGAVKIDSTPPGLSGTLTPSVWTNATVVTINLTAAAGTQPGASPIAYIQQKINGTYQTIDTDTNTTTVDVSQNDTYSFRAYDAVGNYVDRDVVVDKLDRVLPTVSATPDTITGKTVENAPGVQLTFADPAAPAGNKDNISGIASQQYQLVAAGASCDASKWIAYTTGDSITFPSRGSYDLYARAMDRAGNETIELVGSYVIDNAAPTTSPATATVYEHSITGDSTKLHTFAVNLSAADADGDTLTYALIDDAEKTKLDGYGTLVLGADGQLRFTHNGQDVAAADGTITLSFRVTDDSGEANAASNISTVTVTMRPVNDRPADPASGPAIDTPLAFYRKNVPLTLNWGAGSDSETATTDLTYEVQVNAGSGWVAAGTTAPGVTTMSLTAPDGNSDAWKYRVRTVDGNTADLNLNGQTGAAKSDWVEGPAYKLDNTAPTASHTHEQDTTDSSFVIVTLTPGDGTHAWQSGVAGVTFTDTTNITHLGGNRYKIPGQGSYAFTITDNAGNEHLYNVAPGMPDDPVMTYTTTHTRQGRTINVTWNHTNSTGCAYLLEVSYDDGGSWTSLRGRSDAHTAKNYSYTVPGSYTAAPDTAKMRFRVRAWKDVLQSANWAEGSNIICDSTNPDITLTPSTTAHTAGNVTVAVQVDDAPAGLDSVSIQVGSAAPSVASGLAGAQSHSDTATVTANNTTVTVIATDACGNSTTKTYTVTNIDKSAPTVGATAYKTTDNSTLSPGGTSNAPLRFELAFDEVGVAGMDEMRYAITNSTAAPASGDWVTTTNKRVSQGRHELTVYYVHMYAKDRVGNEVQDCIGPFTIVNGLPHANNLEYTVDEGGSVQITLDAVDYDPGDYIDEYVVVGPGPDYAASFTPASADPDEANYTYTHDGSEPVGARATTSFTYYAVDSRAEQSNTATVTIRIRPVNDPPELSGLTPAVIMDWNTHLDLGCDLFDPDDAFTKQNIRILTSNADIIPLYRVQLVRTPDSDRYKGRLELRIRPLPDTYTTSDPVRLTIIATDPSGAEDRISVDITVEEKPRPPQVQDQYYFVMKDGSVSDTVRAELGGMGTGLTYSFGALSGPDMAQGVFSYNDMPNDPTGDPAFTFAASSTFDAVSVPVRVTQQNEDGSESIVNIQLHFRSEAITFEKTENDQVITVLPAYNGAGGDAIGVSSSNEQLLRSENCTVEVDPNTGELRLRYAHEPYRYGRTDVEITLPDGSIITIPIIVQPENDAPQVLNQFTKGVVNDAPAGRAAPASANFSASLYADTVLRGSLDADDSLDDFPPGNGMQYDQSYACTVFQYSLVDDVANGTLALNSATGGYTYTPNAGYTGADSFTALVEELVGFAENENPPGAQLEGDVEDITLPGGEPLLARFVRIDLGVVAKPAPPVNSTPSSDVSSPDSSDDSSDSDSSSAGSGPSSSSDGGPGDSSGASSPSSSSAPSSSDSRSTGPAPSSSDSRPTGPSGPTTPTDPSDATPGSSSADPGASADAGPAPNGQTPGESPSGNASANGRPPAQTAQGTPTAEDDGAEPGNREPAEGGRDYGTLEQVEESRSVALAAAEAEAAAEGRVHRLLVGLVIGVVLGLLFLLLLFGCFIRVRYHVVRENGEEKTITRRRMRRIHCAGEQEAEELRYTLPDEQAPEGTSSMELHFGWFYRRRFYEHEITLTLGDKTCIAYIPEKKQYRESKGIRLLPGDFTEKA